MVNKLLNKFVITFILLALTHSLKAQQVCPGNLLTNPSFENGLNSPTEILNPTGWTGGGYAEYPANQAQWIINGNSYGKLTQSGSSLQQDVTVNTGMNYLLTFNAGMFQPSTNLGVVSLQFIDGSNAPISTALNYNITHDINAIPGVYLLSNVNTLLLSNSPANASSIRVKVSYQNNNINQLDSVIIDGLCLTASPACNNVINGGVIGNTESYCGTGFIPTPIQNISLPAGGIGSIDYVWLQSNDGGINFTVIPGANDSIYAPPYITQSTWYRRCAQRSGCGSYIGESDWIMKKVSPLPIVDAGNTIYLGCNVLSGVLNASYSQNVSYINWSPSAGLSSANITQPFAFPTTTTTYTLSVTDIHNCVNTDTVTVFVSNTNLSAPNITSTSNLPLCYGSTFTLKATGIIGSSFNWVLPLGCTGTIDNSISGESTLTVQNVSQNCTGLYSVTQTLNNCTSPNNSINITTYDSIQTQITTFSETCFGNGKGSIHVVVNGVSGNNMIGYSIQAACQNGTSGNFNWINPGTYTVTVVDQACTTITHSYIATVNPGAIIPPPIVPLQIIGCTGDLLTMSGTTTLPATNINWTFSGNQFNAIGNPLLIYNASTAMTGKYIAKSIDSNGCASTQVATDVIIYEKPIIDHVQVNCKEGSANVVITASVGVGTIQYSWDGINYQNLNQFFNVAPGNYILHVKNSPSNCETTLPIFIPNCNCINTPEITFNIPQVSCGLTPIPISTEFTNVSNASWSTTGNGLFSIKSGTSPLTSMYTPSINDLATGHVTLILTTDDPDGAGLCMPVSQSFTILLKDSLSTPIITQQNATYCKGDTVILIASNSNSPIGWYGVGGFYTSGNTATITGTTQFLSGDYVAIAQGNGCISKSDTHLLIINAPPSLNLSTQTINESCEGNGNGEISVNITGGTGVYNACYIQYSNCTMNAGSPINFKWMKPGNYTIYVSDANCPNGWTTINDTIESGLHVDMPLAALYNNPVCEGEDLILTAVGPAGDYTWTDFKNSCILNGINVIRPNATVGMSGMYKVDRIINGCASKELYLNVKVFGQPEIISVDTTCIGIDSGNITVNSQLSSNDTLEYSINNGAYQQSNIFTNLSNGLYNVAVRTKGSDCIETFTNTEVTCLMAVGKEVIINVFPNPNDGTFTVNAALPEASSNILISVFDMNGKTIYEKATEAEFGILKHAINIQNYAAGSYMLRILIDGERYIIPIMINHK